MHILAVEYIGVIRDMSIDASSDKGVDKSKESMV